MLMWLMNIDFAGGDGSAPALALQRRFMRRGSTYWTGAVLGALLLGGWSWLT